MIIAMDMKYDVLLFRQDPLIHRSNISASDQISIFNQYTFPTGIFIANKDNAIDAILHNHNSLSFILTSLLSICSIHKRYQE
ncbi:hypothetical protein BvCmsNSP002_03765 [Escherichia coli]|nr:hypothetical protein BvCmsNSP002_03765 [Escherichia coli]GDR57165.1 hypothetical protein BvCmsNSP078_04689 [Escherichia coli]GDT94174.1 hypothetical protein BvCmsOUP024_03144 [Escherichia coli]GDU80243.1 hypothetical protein BvCmsSIP042_03757 [Escherichia coli]